MNTYIFSSDYFLKYLLSSPTSASFIPMEAHVNSLICIHPFFSLDLYNSMQTYS